MKKKAQEEMVGFALIIIIVMIILMVFLFVAINNSDEKEGVESYEVLNFEQSMLQTTSKCIERYDPNYVDVRRLIFLCSKNGECLDGRDSCIVLNETLKEIFERSWVLGEDSVYKGYEMNVTSEGKEIIYVFEGNKTRNSKGAVQDFSKSGEEISIEVSVYY